MNAIGKSNISKETQMTNRQIVQVLAKRFLERSEALGYKGKKADNAALDYFCGAATFAEELAVSLASYSDEQGKVAAITAQQRAQHLGIVCALFIAIRGMFAVRELATRVVK